MGFFVLGRPGGTGTGGLTYPGGVISGQPGSYPGGTPGQTGTYPGMTSPELQEQGYKCLKNIKMHITFIKLMQI